MPSSAKRNRIIQKVVHVCTAEKDFSQVLTLLDQIYHKKKKTGFLLDHKLFLVPDTASLPCLATGKDSIDFTATCREYHATEVKKMVTLKLQDTIKEFLTPLSENNPANLNQVLMGR